MLIPRFTVRQLLVITALCALAALVVSLALRGEAWAIALTLALASIVLAALAAAVMFFAAWLISFVMPGSTRGDVHRPKPANHTRTDWN
jgi:hypothetical protein